jgi:hypothetical protein
VWENPKKSNFNGRNHLHRIACEDFKQGCQMVYFQTKNPIWVTFGGPYIGKIDLFYGHLK